jgi:uncharacterized protein (DUF1501 family)
VDRMTSFGSSDPNHWRNLEAALSFPDDDRNAPTRRRFLQLSGMTAGAVAATSLLSRVDAAWGAPPIGGYDGVLVVVLMGGGNDGLSMVAPVGDGAYYDKRGGLAVPASAALAVGPGEGLHPALVNVKRRFDEGKVAVIRGVGHPAPDLSHFSSMAAFMAGWAGGGPPTSGWLGRYLDGLGGAPDVFHGVTVGSSVPLHMVGRSRRGTAVEANGADDLLVSPDVNDAILRDGLRLMTNSPSSRGAWADALARSSVDLLTMSSSLAPLYEPALPTDALARDLTFCARLVNADLGARVLTVSFGDFDTHAGQPSRYLTLMQRFDNAVEAFFATLDPRFASRVALMNFSEFGRRAASNGSQGTDHGTTSSFVVIGDRVKGGLYGAQPSLTALDRSGNLVSSIDFRSIYATVAADWLRADDHEILGASYEKLGFFAPGGPGSTGGGGTGPLTCTSVGSSTAPGGYWVAGEAGQVWAYGTAGCWGNSPASSASPLAALAARPSRDGYWLVGRDGAVFSFGQAPFLGGMNGTGLQAPIVDAAATPSGNGYWLLGRDGGVFSFGDAAFYGSTGDIRLNQPVVGMAAVPTGGGYWFVAADGGIFAFGPNARFYGSMGGTSLNKPVVGMAPTPTGNGYWLVASDGGIFAFGDAEFHGSTGDIRLNQPIVGMVPTATGHGYWFVAADGGVFAFGDAPFLGSAASSGAVVVAMA